jgi:carbon-monoxide dehydrogenase medium subunit
MKAAAFAAIRPASLASATALLADSTARPIAGGQSLGPMLNLRVARPERVVALDRLPDLLGATVTEDAVTLGACTTHAAIADGRTPDIGDGILAAIAGGIAYRAVRTRGTIGGSLCHADPAADWLTTLTALGGSVLTTTRTIPVAEFVVGAYRTVLAAGEIVRAVRIPRPSSAARFGYHKLCRKPGEFAHAMAAILVDSAADTRRLAIGATGGAPILLTGDAASVDGATGALAAFPIVERHLHLVAVSRALAKAGA